MCHLPNFQASDLKTPTKAKKQPEPFDFEISASELLVDA
jgi:hypothetical protein